MIHLITSLRPQYRDIALEGLQRHFWPTHISKLQGPSTTGGSQNGAIREMLVTDSPADFIYDVQTYFLRADLLSAPVLVDDTVCKKLTGMDLALWRAVQAVIRRGDTVPRKYKSEARKLNQQPLPFENSACWPVGNIDYTEVGQSDLPNVIADIKQAELIAVDVETPTDHPRAGVVCMTVSVRDGQAYYIPRDLVPSVLPHIDWAKATGHGLKFDLQALGVYPPAVGDDTHIGSSLVGIILGQRGLDEIVKAEYGYQMLKFTDIVPAGMTIDQINHRVRFFYACDDAMWSRRVCFRIWPRLTKEMKDGIYSIQRRLVPIIAEMERNGMYTDKAALVLLKDEQEKQLADIEQRIYAKAGEVFNLNSHPQVKKILYDKLKIPKRRFAKKSVSSDAVALKQITHPIARDIEDHRDVTKLKDTYTLPLLNNTDPNTLRVHPRFNMAVVASGRLSSDIAQVIPKTPTYRGVVIAMPGNSIMKIDCDQLELRVLAGRSGGSTMRHIFASGGDIHAHTASVVLDKDPLLLTTGERDLYGKRCNFAIVYGAMAMKLVEVGICKTIEEANIVIHQLRDAYPEEMEYIARERERIRRERVVVTQYGRVRTFSDFTPIDSIEREGFNHGIQGTAVELVFIGMINAMPYIRQHNALLINQVHDEVVLEVKTPLVPLLQADVVREMEAVPFSVPLKVSVKVGDRWLI